MAKWDFAFQSLENFDLLIPTSIWERDKGESEDYLAWKIDYTVNPVIIFIFLFY